MPLVKARPLSVHTVPDFWWCIKANGLFTLVSIPLRCLCVWGCHEHSEMRVLRKRLLNWIVPSAPKYVFPNASCPLPCLGRKKWCSQGEGSQHFIADQWFGCTVVGSKAWPTSVVVNQLQVGPSCWCLVFGVGRWKRFDSALMHRFSWRLSAQRWCVSRENFLGSEG